MHISCGAGQGFAPSNGAFGSPAQQQPVLGFNRTQNMDQAPTIPGIGTVGTPVCSVPTLCQTLACMPLHPCKPAACTVFVIDHQACLLSLCFAPFFVISVIWFQDCAKFLCGLRCALLPYCSFFKLHSFLASFFARQFTFACKLAILLPVNISIYRVPSHGQKTVQDKNKNHGSF